MKNRLQTLINEIRIARKKASKSKYRHRIYQEILLKDAEYRIMLALTWEKR